MKVADEERRIKSRERVRRPGEDFSSLPDHARLALDSLGLSRPHATMRGAAGKMRRCPICGCLVREDRLTKHRRKAHPTIPVSHVVRPVREYSIWASHEPKMLKQKKGYVRELLRGTPTSGLSPEEINYKDRGQRGSKVGAVQTPKSIRLISTDGWNQATLEAMSL